MFLHMKLLANRRMSLRIARRRQMTPHKGASKSAMDERHIVQMKSVLEYIHSISCTAIATEFGISPASVYCIFPRAYGNEKFVQSGFCTCSVMTKKPFEFFSPPPICSIAEMKALRSSITFEW